MKGFDSSSEEEEEDDNIGLLNFDSDDEEDVQDLQKPQLKPVATKKKSVNEKKVIIMSALITICGKQKANKFLLSSISARNAVL